MSGSRQRIARCGNFGESRRVGGSTKIVVNDVTGVNLTRSRRNSNCILRNEDEKSINNDNDTPGSGIVGWRIFRAWIIAEATIGLQQIPSNCYVHRDDLLGWFHMRLRDYCHLLFRVTSHVILMLGKAKFRELVRVLIYSNDYLKGRWEFMVMGDSCLGGNLGREFGSCSQWDIFRGSE